MSAGFIGDLAVKEKTFSADYNAVWEATMDALTVGEVYIKEENKETGEIHTEWLEGPPIGRGSGLFIGTYWVERFQFIITISKASERATRVIVLCQVQEKTKGGTRSFRWESKKSSGEHEQQLLDKVGEILANQ